MYILYHIRDGAKQTVAKDPGADPEKLTVDN